MVTVLPAQPRRGFGAGFEQAFPEAFQKGLENEVQSRYQNKLLEKKAGLEKEKTEIDLKKDQARTDTIAKYFGPNVAELYGSLTEGGKTQLSNIAVESLHRGLSFEDVLKEKLLTSPQEVQEIIQDNQVPQEEIEEEQISPRPTKKSSNIGLLPKEIASKEIQEKKFKREHESKRSDKVLEEAYDLSKNFPVQQANIDLIKNALHDVSGFDQDFVAELFHYEPLRTAKGAQLKSAGKDLFIKTIRGAGTRPNQWIEQQIGSALTQIGKTKEANQTIAELSQFQLDLDKKKVDLINKLEEKYEKELGYVPGKIGREAQDLLKPYAIQRQEQLAYDLRKIYEEEQGIEKLSKQDKVPSGTPLTVEMAKALLKRTNGDKTAAQTLAKKIGYTIPSSETYAKEI